MKKFSPFSFFAVAYLVVCPFAARAASAPGTAPHARIFAFLPDATRVQAEILQELQTRAESRDVPRFPTRQPLLWQLRRWREAPASYKVLSRLLYGDLFLVQKMLSYADVNERRVALRLALQAAFLASQRLNDEALRVRIFEAWLLPNLEVASTEDWKDGSRRMILERACAAYAATGETDKQLALLKCLCDEKSTLVGECSGNSRDWARVKLADLLVKRGDYQAAIEQLEKVESGAMSGSRAWLQELREKMKSDSAVAAKPQ
jgi:hypothetical protein